MAHKKLYRDIEHSSIGGVASGLADFFDMDVIIFRVLFVITALFGGGFLIYVVLWIIVPPKIVVLNAKADTENESSAAYQNTAVNEDKTKETKNRGLIAGLVLILIGIVFLVNVFSDFCIRDLWPILVIAVGVIIIVSGFSFKKS